MAASPKYKVYDDQGNYLASCRDATLAAALIGAAGWDGWRVKYEGRVIFAEGASTSARDSVDEAATVMDENLAKRARRGQEDR